MQEKNDEREGEKLYKQLFYFSDDEFTTEAKSAVTKLQTTQLDKQDQERITQIEIGFEVLRNLLLVFTKETLEIKMMTKRVFDDEINHQCLFAVAHQSSFLF